LYNSGVRFPKIATTFLILIFGGAILFVSLVRAGWEILAAEDQEKLRVSPIRFGLDLGRGQIEWYCYKIPTVEMTPDNPLYSLKSVRDNLWLGLARLPEEKSNLALLMADKKIAESKKLLAENKTEMALDCGQEALEKLKYSHELAEKAGNNEQETRDINGKIYQAGYAYKMILGGTDYRETKDKEKYEELISQLDNWNEEQRKEKDEKKE
jgi:hypothetical protein